MRRSLWTTALSNTSRKRADVTKVQAALLDRLTAVLCNPA
jgi:hypothetical protein